MAEKVAILCAADLSIDGKLRILVQIPPFVPVSTVEVIDLESGATMLEGEYKG